MLTLRDLLRDLDVRLLTVDQGLDAPVRWVHITELVDPTPWLSGGELLLTTGLQLDTVKKQRELIARLADHNLAGLGFGTGFTHKRVPRALLTAASNRAFPVFEVPYEVPFIAVTEKAFTRLVNEQYTVLQRSIAAHQRLERIVLSERGLDEIVAAIASLIGGAVLLYDAHGDQLAQHHFRVTPDEELLDALAAELRERARTGDRRTFVPSAGGALAGRALALPVASTGEPDSASVVPRAWLLAIKDAGGLTELDRLTLHQAVTVVALELLRQRAALDTERRLAGDVLSEILAGGLAGAELTRRLDPFGLGGRVAVMVLSPQRNTGAATEQALAGAISDEASGGLAAHSGELVCALLPGHPDEQLFGLARALHERVCERLGGRIDGGVGRAVAAEDVRRAYLEARCALEARTLAHPSSEANGSVPGLATYQELGSFQLLLSLQDSDALRLYCDSILGPIESGDDPYGGELMHSLEVFIEENGQWERAARRLFCHRHTLRYRIRKVEQLTARDLSLARDRIEFWLALRGRELVR